MNTNRVVALMLCAAFAGTGCGTRTTPLAAGNAGACTHALGGDREPVDSQWRDDATGWVAAAPAGAPRAAEPEHHYGDLVVAPTSRVGVRVTRVLRPWHGADLTAVKAVEMDRAAANQLAAETARGATIVLGLRDVTGRGQFADFAVSLRGSGEVVFLGECAYDEATQPFASYVRHRGGHGDRRAARDIWLSLVGSPGGADDKAFRSLLHDGPQWADLSPAVRVVGRDTVPRTPANVLAGLTEVTLNVELPAAWRAFPAVVCTRLSLGWGGECARLGAAPTGPLPLAAFMAPGEDLELWLMGPDGSIASAVGVIGTVPARLARPDGTIELRASATVTAPEQLTAIATSSHDAVRVTPSA